MRIIGKFLGLDIIEDDKVKEIRLPPEFIKDLVETGKMIEANEYANPTAKKK